MQTSFAYAITISAQVSGGVSGLLGGGTESLSAFVDPTFSLAPSVVNPEQYTLEFSPGIGNISSAPGPVPGAGLLSLVFLVLAGVWTKARGFLAR